MRRWKLERVEYDDMECLQRNYKYSPLCGKASLEPEYYLRVKAEEEFEVCRM